MQADAAWRRRRHPERCRKAETALVCPDDEIQLRGFWIACGLPAEAWPAAIERFLRHRQLVERHSARAGLMGPAGVGGFLLKHVADSLAALKVYPELLRGPTRLADVGSGAGLPGLALAIALPGLNLTAIESNHRKADFIQLAAEALGLTDRVDVVCGRSRGLAADERFAGRFALVAARAVAPAGRLIRECRGLIAPGGSALFYKTPAAVAEELPAASREAGRRGLTVEASDIIDLPAGAGTRQFIRVAAAPPD